MYAPQIYNILCFEHGNRRSIKYVGLDFLLHRHKKRRFLCKFVIMEYNYDEVAVQELLQWADTAELPQSLRLDQAAFIFDVRRCVESDAMCVRDHYPDPFYNPAINRLYQIREMTDKKSNIK